MILDAIDRLKRHKIGWVGVLREITRENMHLDLSSKSLLTPISNLCRAPKSAGLFGISVGMMIRFGGEGGDRIQRGICIGEARNSRKWTILPLRSGLTDGLGSGEATWEYFYGDLYG